MIEWREIDPTDAAERAAEEAARVLSDCPFCDDATRIEPLRWVVDPARFAEDMCELEAMSPAARAWIERLAREQAPPKLMLNVIEPTTGRRMVMSMNRTVLDALKAKVDRAARWKALRAQAIAWSIVIALLTVAGGLVNLLLRS